MPSKYADNTSVSVDRSKAEVEKILTKYGADQFSSGWTGDKIVVMFRMNNRYIRIEMSTPTKGDIGRVIRGGYSVEEKVAAENRRRWRALVLYVKAKLESVESNIISFEEAFMAHIILPNGKTVGQFMQPQIESAYKSGEMPTLLSEFRRSA